MTSIIQEPIYDRLLQLLETAGAEYDIIDHPPEGRTEIVSAMRGHPASAAAKAMVLKVKRPNGPIYVLAVLGGDRRVDMDAAAVAYAGRSASFAPPEVATELTGSVMGAVPPFSFDERLNLLADEHLARQPRIYFNAARLDRSLALDTRAWLDLAQPRIARVAK